MEGHPALDRIDVKTQFPVWCQTPVPVDNERRGFGIQSSLRFRRLGCWFNGLHGQSMAVSTCSFSLPGRFHDATQVLHTSWKLYQYQAFTIKFCYCRPIPNNGTLVLTLDTRSCQGTETEVDYLEHVQAVISLNSTRRGEVEMFLTSPMGTRWVDDCILSRQHCGDVDSSSKHNRKLLTVWLTG